MASWQLWHPPYCNAFMAEVHSWLGLPWLGSVSSTNERNPSFAVLLSAAFPVDLAHSSHEASSILKCSPEHYRRTIGNVEWKSPVSLTANWDMLSWLNSFCCLRHSASLKSWLVADKHCIHRMHTSQRITVHLLLKQFLILNECKVEKLLNVLGLMGLGSKVIIRTISKFQRPQPRFWCKRTCSAVFRCSAVWHLRGFITQSLSFKFHNKYDAA